MKITVHHVAVEGDSLQLESSVYLTEGAMMDALWSMAYDGDGGLEDVPDNMADYRRCYDNDICDAMESARLSFVHESEEIDVAQAVLAGKPSAVAESPVTAAQ